MRHATRLKLVLVITCAALAAQVGVAHAAPLKDVDDPFYKYDKPLQDVPTGTILKRRSINLATSGVSLPFKSSQVLYRSTKTNGEPVAVVATVMRPLLARTTQILSYQTAYDDLGSTCTPSYLLQGPSGSATNTLEFGFMLAYLAQGFTVVTSDYEGLTHDYTAGQGAGYATLDGIRAARTEIGVPDGTPVGMVGYSGGAIATEWAAEIAPKYTPEMNIVGAAAGGIPVHYTHTINYIDGSPAWASVIPWLFNGLFRGADVDPTPFLSAKGKQLRKEVSDKCLDAGAFPGLHIADMIEGGRDYRTIRPLAKVIGSQVMGTAGTPRAPMFFGNGNADGIGDGIMIASDVEALAHQYCQKGVPVTYTEYPGLDHVLGIPPFEAQALVFLQSQFNGVSLPNSCSTIGPGNSLTPLKLPPLTKLVLGKVRRSKGRYTLAVRVDREEASKATLSVYAVRNGKRKRVATLRPSGALTNRSRTFKLPIDGDVEGRTYDIVVNADSFGEKVTRKTSFRVPG